MENKEKVILGRTAIEKYWETKRIKGSASTSDVDLLKEELLALGFESTQAFYEFNFTQNFIEADRCYRYRRVDNEEAIALCDKCVGRSVTPCFVEACVSEYLDPFAGIVPDSNITLEKTMEATRLGVTVPHIPSVASVYMTKDTGFTYAPYCIGKAVKIIEPDFDIFWKMEDLIKFGKFRHEEMLRANGV